MSILGADVDVIRSVSLGLFPHGFLGRRGGRSTGEIHGLNVGFGSSDDRATIDENRRLAIGAILGGAQLATVYQTHSAEVVYADRAWPIDERPRADGIVTDRDNLLIGILTADCAPVLFGDETAGVVGAAHAGWRGALAGVTDNVIAAMEFLGARRGNIRAAVGPCISKLSYEVNEEFRSLFLTKNEDDARFFSSGPSQKPHFDLEGYVVSRLLAAGIGEVEALGLDTYDNPDRFFSYRYATHHGHADYGRQLSAIAVPS